MSPLLPSSEVTIGFDVGTADGPTPTSGEVFGNALTRDAIRVDAFGLQRRRYEKTLRQMAREVFGENSTVEDDAEKAGRRRSAEARAQIGRDQLRLSRRRQPRGRDETLPEATRDEGAKHYTIEELERLVFERISKLTEAGVGNFANMPSSREALMARVRQNVRDEFIDAETVLQRREEGLGGFAVEMGGGMVGGLTSTDILLGVAGGGRRGFGTGVAIDGGLGVLGEALTLPTQYQVAADLDIKPPDPLVQLATAGVFSAGLSAAVRGTGAAIGAVRGRGREGERTDELVDEARRRGAELSPAGRGALDKIEADKAVGAARPKGTDPADFEDGVRRAEEAVDADDPSLLPKSEATPEALEPVAKVPAKVSGVTERIIYHGTEPNYGIRPNKGMNPILALDGRESKLTRQGAGENMDRLLNNEFRILQEKFGAELTINDAIAKAGSSRETKTKGSRHFHGDALDISTAGMSNADKMRLLQAALDAGFRGFGFGRNILHIDTRKARQSWAYGNSSWAGLPIADVHKLAREGRVDGVTGTTGIGRSTTSRIIHVESRGRLYAKNPNSSAFGPGQFLDGTWLELVDRYRPDLRKGRSKAEVLALRSNPELAKEMVERYAQENRAFLAKNGLPFHDGALYLAHFAGPGGAKTILSADPSTPIGKLMTRDQIKANAGIRFGGKRFSEFTAADLVNWAKKKMGLAAGDVTDLPSPTSVTDFDPLSLRTDADAFQYKRSDPEGVTERLLSENLWSPEAGIGVMVFERGDGLRFIADGHQRLALARRLAAAGETDIRLQGYLYREADGWTPDAMRVFAALKNIRQESGTPADAAKILRDHPELRGQLNASRGFMLHADGLTKLAPNAFDAVINDVIPEHYASIIGRTMPGDDQLQMAAIGLMRRSPPENATQAELVAREVRRLGLEERSNNAQADLFDDMDLPGETLVLDRAKILDAALRELKADKKLFAKLNDEADRIEEVGNRVETTANEARQATAERAIEAAIRLANEPGPVRDALDGAARSARQGSRRAAVAQFLGDLRAAAEGDFRGGPGRGASDAGVADANGGSAASAARSIADDLTPPADAPAPLRREDWADPATGPGPRAETELLETDVRAALDGEDADAQGFLDFDIGEGMTTRDLLADLEADAEFIDQVNLCSPRGG